MASADFASVAAAQSAGYVLVVTDNGRLLRNGLSEPDRFTASLEKWVTGDPDGGSGNRFGAFGVASTSAVAQTQALASLNNDRLNRYGADTGTTSNGKKNTNSHTRDAT